MKQKVLVVDDDKGIRALLNMRLNREGFAVEEAEGGSEALSLLEKQGGNFDIILCDLNMPEVSGQEVLEFVRSHPIHKSTPFLMLTAHNEDEKVSDAAKSGVSEYILKPFTAEDLVQKIRRFLPPKAIQ